MCYIHICVHEKSICICSYMGDMYMYIYKHTYMLYTHTHICVYIYVHMCVCVCVYICFLEYLSKYQVGRRVDSKIVCVLSHVPHSATPWTVACQPPLSLGFPSQEYWSGLPFTPLGDPHAPGIEPGSPVAPAFQVYSLPLSHHGSPIFQSYKCIIFIAYISQYFKFFLFCIT